MTTTLDRYLGCPFHNSSNLKSFSYWICDLTVESRKKEKNTRTGKKIVKKRKSQICQIICVYQISTFYLSIKNLRNNKKVITFFLNFLQISLLYWIWRPINCYERNRTFTLWIDNFLRCSKLTLYAYTFLSFFAS